MTSLSNVIKYSQYVPVDIMKQLDLSKSYASESLLDDEYVVDETITSPDYISPINQEAERAREEMLSDAKQFAERQIREASEEAERILEEAKEQLESWWQQKREQDEHLVEAMKAEGFQQGFDEGKVHATQVLQTKIDEMMEEAQSVLKQAYETKEQIIQEAEPFLVELSCAIAEKVIDRELSGELSYMTDLIKKNLARKREQGILTLCVSPAQFNFVQAVREELSLAIDSQAELHIIPDSSVKDKGCVIRSSFGSIDARIDTQLVEIKKELIRISLQNDEIGNYHEET